MCQVAAQELGVPLEAVFTSESASNTVPNTSPTAGSSGSDLNGMAVQDACRKLRKRLEPYRSRLGPDASFARVAEAAWMDRVSLSATGHMTVPKIGYTWKNCALSSPCCPRFIALCSDV
jgi:xanthine dehydrogenase/oxidase